MSEKQKEENRMRLEYSKLLLGTLTMLSCQVCGGFYPDDDDRGCRNQSCRNDHDWTSFLRENHLRKKADAKVSEKLFSPNGAEACAKVVCEQLPSHNGGSAGAEVIDGQQPSDNRESAGAGAEVCEQRFIPMGGILLTIKYGDVGNPYEVGIAECLRCGVFFAADSYCRGCNK